MKGVFAALALGAGFLGLSAPSAVAQNEPWSTTQTDSGMTIGRNSAYSIDENEDVKQLLITLICERELGPVLVFAIETPHLYGPFLGEGTINQPIRFGRATSSGGAEVIGEHQATLTPLGDSGNGKTFALLPAQNARAAFWSQFSSGDYMSFSSVSGGDEVGILASLNNSGQVYNTLVDGSGACR